MGARNIMNPDTVEEIRQLTERWITREGRHIFVGKGGQMFTGGDAIKQASLAQPNPTKTVVKSKEKTSISKPKEKVESPQKMGLVDKDGVVHSISIKSATPALVDKTIKEWGGVGETEYGKGFKHAVHTESLTTKAIQTKGGKTQALLTYEKSDKEVYVHYLESSPLNRGGKGLRGGGSTALAIACNEVPKGGRLTLTGTGDSIGYYRKIGMKSNGFMCMFDYNQAQAFAKKMGVAK